MPSQIAPTSPSAAPTRYTSREAASAASRAGAGASLFAWPADEQYNARRYPADLTPHSIATNYTRNRRPQSYDLYTAREAAAAAQGGACFVAWPGDEPYNQIINDYDGPATAAEETVVSSHGQKRGHGLGQKQRGEKGVSRAR